MHRFIRRFLLGLTILSLVAFYAIGIVYHIPRVFVSDPNQMVWYLIGLVLGIVTIIITFIGTVLVFRLNIEFTTKFRLALILLVFAVGVDGVTLILFATNIGLPDQSVAPLGGGYGLSVAFSLIALWIVNRINKLLI